MTPAHQAARRDRGSPRERSRPAPLVSFVRRATSGGFQRNTLSLALSSIVLGLGGMVFWVLAARTNSTAAIGIAITIVSAINLIVSATALGWPQLAMRDGSNGRRGRVLAARAGVASLVTGSVIVAVVTIVPGHFGLALDDVGAGLVPVAALVGFSVVVAAVGSCLEGVLIARRSAHLVLLESAASVVVRLAAALVLSAHGAVGLLAANALGCLISTAGALTFVRRTRARYPDAPAAPVPLRADTRFVTSAGIPNLIALAPMTLLPTVVLQWQGAAAAACFTIAVSISFAVRMLPSVTSQTMLAEVGLGTNPRLVLARAFRVTIAASTLLAALISAAAPWIGDLYGDTFDRHGSAVIMLLAASGALAGANYLLDSMLLALRHSSRFAIVNVLGSCVVFAAVAAGSRHSIEFAGLGYVIAEIAYAGIGWLALTTSTGWHAAGRAARSEHTPQAPAVVASPQLIETGGTL